MAKKKYEWKITLKKFAFLSLQILIAGWLTLVYERPELMFLVPLFEAVKNWLKNK